MCINEGRKLTYFDIKMFKVNKTFDEWVEVLTDENYIYCYDDRKKVASKLLCYYNSEYKLNEDGFIVQTSVETDKALYGDWENAFFTEDIQKIIDNILLLPEVEITLNESGKYNQVRYDEKIAYEERCDYAKYKYLEKQGLYKKEEGKLTSASLRKRLNIAWNNCDEIVSKLKFGEIQPEEPLMIVDQLYHISCKNKKIYIPYYNIDKHSIFDQILNGATAHQSYIDEGINICYEILDNAENEIENVDFANKFLSTFVHQCYICKKTAEYTCERCDEYICNNCQAAYNMFTQIDFNCCEKCAQNKN